MTRSQPSDNCQFSESAAIVYSSVYLDRSSLRLRRPRPPLHRSNCDVPDSHRIARFAEEALPELVLLVPIDHVALTADRLELMEAVLQGIIADIPRLPETVDVADMGRDSCGIRKNRRRPSLLCIGLVPSNLRNSASIEQPSSSYPSRFTVRPAKPLSLSSSSICEVGSDVTETCHRSDSRPGIAPPLHRKPLV